MRCTVYLAIRHNPKLGFNFYPRVCFVADSRIQTGHNFAALGSNNPIYLCSDYVLGGCIFFWQAVSMDQNQNLKLLFFGGKIPQILSFFIMTNDDLCLIYQKKNLIESIKFRPVGVHQNLSHFIAK